MLLAGVVVCKSEKVDNRKSVSVSVVALDVEPEVGGVPAHTLAHYNIETLFLSFNVK